ncbi:WYL domain-containing protein [Burkholderia cenocepacia]|uniref:helix-turn-helix transcriptional regulator n=1 Tax=Burkholderia cenocepacia TaxID=95486 RepID=UPI00158B02AF|nr:WYL domain-containing protein [Burkholderia cenocepacia]MBR8380494.1 WYL domain-containing protein [Burkholderia cenocepacia]MBR8415058.1 WYL domain-containing protein [Burkholderia cenocepacia]MCA8238979.1 WYL domain-containing protein [Burkholderia cenocepacia]MDS0849640.1 WYL domain-containing protein [Burkholderia cenocepacia]
MESPFERLDALRSLLLWEGELSRSRLQRLFNLGETRASQWVREFRDAFPQWVAWDTRRRRYHATYAAYHEAERELASRSARAASLTRYLALTGLTLDDPGRRDDGIAWATYPELSAPHPRVFSVLRSAIETRRVIEITYSSMRNPQPHDRNIAPHGLIRAGRRWHVRAWCENTRTFRDFALGRISGARMLERDATHDSSEDEAWRIQVPVRLIAHPALPEPQALVIRNEYFDGASSRLDHCRGCLVQYYLQDLRVAVDARKEHPPEYQLALDNIDQVQPWLFP